MYATRRCCERMAEMWSRIPPKSGHLSFAEPGSYKKGKTHRLHHIHLPSRGPSLYPPYTIASRLQEHLRRRLLDFKDSNPNIDTPPNPEIVRWSRSGKTLKKPPRLKPTGPPPFLISFTPLPTYTLGRRQTAPLSPDELARLQAPLVHYPPVKANDSPDDKPNDISNPVTVLSSPRGGLTTYHGPGQVVLWPVLDLRAKWHKSFTVRCYARLLEDTTIAALGALSWPHEGSLTYLKGFTTEDPGVWVNTAILSPSSTAPLTITEALTGEPEGRIAKIAALGIHLRRHVSALGTAINVNMPGPEDTNPETNPWARIVPCGLEGKTVTSIHRELEARLRKADVPGRDEKMIERVTKDLDEEVVASEWAGELHAGLKCKGDVVSMTPKQAARFVLHVCGWDGGGGGGENATGQERDARTVELEKRYIEWLKEEFDITDPDRVPLTEFSWFKYM